MKFKTYVINLEKRKDRINELSIPLDYEIFIATDGKIKYQFLNTSARNKSRLGCLDSHKRLLEHNLNEDLEAVLVFEDDVKPCENFEDKFYEIIKSLPENWDMIYFGGWGQVDKFSDKLNKAIKILTTHSYLVNKKFIPKVLEQFEKDTESPVDVSFAQIQSKNNCFITNPPLCSQKTGYSDIVNKNTEYSEKITFI
jgi:GR25 family glycosyltransferase involved in LPS biosynthesis